MWGIMPLDLVFLSYELTKEVLYFYSAFRNEDEIQLTYAFVWFCCKKLSGILNLFLKFCAQEVLTW